MTSVVSIFLDIGRAFARILLLVVALAAAAVGAASAQSPPAASAPTQECRGIMEGRAGFLEQCGDRLNAWSLGLSEFKRETGSDLHGRFFFYCPIELMCDGEPTIAGRLLPAAEWQASPRDEQTIYELANRLWEPIRPLPPMPSPACPLFDISIAGMAGRAVCFEEPELKGSSVFVVAADDRVAILLAFSQQDKLSSALKEKVVELLPRFKIERATGDAALMKWFR
jgi:hypothetical protein